MSREDDSSRNEAIRRFLAKQRGETVVENDTERSFRLKCLVHPAFYNPEETELAPEKKSTRAILDSASTALSADLTVSNERPVILPEFPDMGNDAYTANPGEYKELLTIALEKTGLSGQELQKRVDAEHTRLMAHAKVAQEAGLAIRYGVSFFRDTQQGIGALSPNIKISGSTTVGAVRRILNAPLDISEPTQRMLGMKRKGK